MGDTPGSGFLTQSKTLPNCAHFAHDCVPNKHVPPAPWLHNPRKGLNDSNILGQQSLQRCGNNLTLLSTTLGFWLGWPFWRGSGGRKVLLKWSARHKDTFISHAVPGVCTHLILLLNNTLHTKNHHHTPALSTAVACIFVPVIEYLFTYFNHPSFRQQLDALWSISLGYKKPLPSFKQNKCKIRSK